MGTELNRRSLFIVAGAVGIAATCGVFWLIQQQALPFSTDKPIQLESKHVTTIIADIDAFVVAQNKGRGDTLPSGGIRSLYFDALTGTVPVGDNAATGISGIAASAAAITLPSVQNGNAVIIDGDISTTTSTSGADNYSLAIDTSGLVTITDNNTGNSQAVTGANYFLFNGAATNTDGSYQSLFIVETGVGATLAAMYNAAFDRVPDLPGLEFYIDQYGTKAVPDLHTAAVFFLGSNEFKDKYAALQTQSDNGGPNDAAFVTTLYSAILHRTASQTEVQFYEDALAGTLTNNGQPLGPVDRATVFEYFTNSPENQQDISGWQINPAKGAVSFGVMTQQAAQAVLASEVASGTLNATAFANMSSTGQASLVINGSSVDITGSDYYGSQGTDPGFYTVVPNLTLNLSAQYYTADIAATNTTVNGVSSGGSVITIYNTLPIVTPIHTTPGTAASGTINLFGNDNWIQVVGTATVVNTTVVNGWNATNVFSGTFSSIPSSVSTFASLVAQPDGALYQGSAGSPISGAAIGAPNQGTWFTTHVLAVNVGALANDSVSTMVAAANAVYTVGDIGTVNQQTSESAFFFGQDPQGNTIVFYWHGDSTHAHTILATDITGAVELVGVQASSLTSANFHH